MTDEAVREELESRRTSMKELSRLLKDMKKKMKEEVVEIEAGSEDHVELSKAFKSISTWAEIELFNSVNDASPNFLRDLHLSCEEEGVNVGHEVFAKAQILVSKQVQKGGKSAIRWPRIILETFARLYSKSVGDYNHLKKLGLFRMPSGRLIRGYNERCRRYAGVDVGRVLEFVKDLQHHLACTQSPFTLEEMSSIIFELDEMIVARDYVVSRNDNVYGLPMTFDVLGIYDKLKPSPT